jgi:hypothetical protein
MQQLREGPDPFYAAAGTSGVAGGPISRRLQLVAQEIRAARDEQLLVSFEMPNLLLSYADEIEAIEAAIRAADGTVTSCLQQQDGFADICPLTHQQEVQLHRSYRQMQQAVGQRMLLQRRHAVVSALLERATAMFEAAQSSEQAVADEQQATQLADEVLQQAEDDAAQGSDDEADEAGAQAAAGLDAVDDDDDYAPSAAAAPASMDAAASSMAGSSTHVPLQRQEPAAAVGQPVGGEADLVVAWGGEVRLIVCCCLHGSDDLRYQPYTAMLLCSVLCMCLFACSFVCC